MDDFIEHAEEAANVLYIEGDIEADQAAYFIERNGRVAVLANDTLFYDVLDQSFSVFDLEKDKKMPKIECRQASPGQCAAGIVGSAITGVLAGAKVGVEIGAHFGPKGAAGGAVLGGGLGAVGGATGAYATNPACKKTCGN